MILYPDFLELSVSILFIDFILEGVNGSVFVKLIVGLTIAFLLT